MMDNVLKDYAFTIKQSLKFLLREEKRNPYFNFAEKTNTCHVLMGNNSFFL